MIEIEVHVKGQGRESLKSPLTVVAVVIIYAITHIDYTQYIKLTHVIAVKLAPYDACRICLVIEVRESIQRSIGLCKMSA